MSDAHPYELAFEKDGIVYVSGTLAFDKDNNVNLHLGYDPKWTEQVLEGFKMREQPERWENGKFIHPHDACFDAAGNIYVVEWVQTGRVTFLKKVS